ncbi:phosphonate ABC transporter ATP-binding protein [Marispirochaeta sp.]|jgi:phosphonate transport system ATP-binding protein|uniref:phosphonate ABC transporter ATP-binding protein n=1 Tax=Marispirochaeta sp. TaxID=2038653 RepID=UPI0029C6D97A|nr:phosphonate ABC transporter ATP-binding protein [Marispirochaeta sp.]
MLEVKDLTKVYPDGTRALKKVSFTVEDGEFLVIIGLSGSGKSTLLRCINRLIDPTEGTIIFDGHDVTAADNKELRQIRRKIGMIFQHFNLVDRSSVLTNALSGRLGYLNPWQSILHKFPGGIRKEAMQALRKVGIEDQAHKRADELSGGQRQRVGIARALMQDPSMILADEPVASLDPVLAHTILGYLEQLNRESGISVLCSLHYLDLVQRYATTVIGLKDGEIVYRGTREDIRSMTDRQFKEIYGEEAERVSAGTLSTKDSTHGEGTP